MSLEDAEGDLMRYIHMGVPLGGFLRLVIENDLMGAMGQADETSRMNLFEICQVVYKECPGAACKSPEAYQSWVAAGVEWRKRHPGTPIGDCTKEELAQVHWNIQQEKQEAEGP